MPYLLLFIGIVLGILLMYSDLVIAPLLALVVLFILYNCFFLRIPAVKWVIMLGFGLILGALSGNRLRDKPRVIGEVCSGYIVKEFMRSVSIRADTCSNNIGVSGHYYVNCGAGRCPTAYSKAEFLILSRNRFGRFVGKGKLEKSLDEKGKGFTLYYYSALRYGVALRMGYFGWLRQKLPLDQSALVTSMLFGDTELSSELTQEMKEVGVLHVVAISGINIAYLLELLTQLQRRFSRKWRTFFEAFVLLSLYFVVGVAVSLLRAIIMSIWGIFRRSIGIRASEWHFLLGLSVLLLIDPAYIFDAGFLLVGSACFGIYIGGAFLRKRVGNGALASIALSVFVWLCVLPVQLIIFNRVSVIGVVVGIILSPFVEALTLIGYVGVALRFFPFISNSLAIVLGVISSMILLVINLFHGDSA